ncbi:hypothetical protein LCGC14_2269300 [marine sediment metagenome]|uniref:Uncharacterized protein n=1 Tax=marine sediment metagenome TaxID=412755 RepID=A0A0F9F9U4_9ZZZZ
MFYSNTRGLLQRSRLAAVAELADAHGLGPCGATCGGSTPSCGTEKQAVDSKFWTIEFLGKPRKTTAYEPLVNCLSVFFQLNALFFAAFSQRPFAVF